MPSCTRSSKHGTRQAQAGHHLAHQIIVLEEFVQGPVEHGSGGFMARKDEGLHLIPDL